MLLVSTGGCLLAVVFSKLLLSLRHLGIHAIFGGFLAGLAMPHDGGFAIALTEKIEDLVTILLLPIVRV